MAQIRRSRSRHWPYRPSQSRWFRPLGDVTRMRIRIWEKEVDEFIKRGILLSKNLKTAYSLIYGQCSEAMRAKLESRAKLEESRPNHHARMLEATADAIGMLENIHTVMFQFQAQWYVALALHKAKCAGSIHSLTTNTVLANGTTRPLRTTWRSSNTAEAQSVMILD